MKPKLAGAAICSLFALLAMPLATAFAADGAPDLPATAKKLTAKDIKDLYSAATYSWTSWNHPEIRKGTIKFDFKKRVTSGTYPQDGVQKPYENDPFRMKGDKICYSTNGTNCAVVYSDGTTIYELNEKGKVGNIYMK